MQSQEVSATSSAVSRPFRVVGYLTGAAVLELVPFDLLTHVNYAFLIPHDDGTFRPLMNPWKLEQVVSIAHANGAMALIAVG